MWRALLSHSGYDAMKRGLGLDLFVHEHRHVVMVGRLAADGQFHCYHADFGQTMPDGSLRVMDPDSALEMLCYMRAPSKDKQLWMKIQRCQADLDLKHARSERAHDTTLLHETKKDLRRNLERRAMGKHARLSAVVDGLKGGSNE